MQLRLHYGRCGSGYGISVSHYNNVGINGCSNAVTKSDEEAYGFTASNIDSFLVNYKSLCRHTYIWPPNDQASTVGSKWQLIENLDIIASRHNQLRPKSVLLEDGATIPANTVVKRTHSESGNHIILPKDGEKRNWDYLRDNSDIPRCRWFAQTYVDLLHYFGEWRVVMMGGEVAYTVHTVQAQSNGVWRRRRAILFWPLDILRCVD